MKHLLFVLLTGLPLLGYSQESNLGNWMIYIGSKKINQNWNWHHEVQYRNYNAFSDMEQLLLRTGFGYNLTENNNNILIGYGYIMSQNYIPGTDNKQDFHENRIYQQFITRQRFNLVSLQHRYRFEQRFIGEDFRMRFRYFLSMNIELTKKEIADNSFYVSIYNELFLNTSDTIFDRDRIYGGLGFRFNKSTRFEIGYMNQIFSKGSRDQINMIALLNF